MTRVAVCRSAQREGHARISGMSDPRNTAHKKKVKYVKEHHPQAQPASASDTVFDDSSAGPEPVLAKLEHDHADLEKSVAVLSKLKEMEFHSRANIETLAKLSLTIEDELKQKEFSEPIGALYSAEDGFHSKIAELIERYHAKCESLKQAA
jgi:hypothetical protein